MRGGGGLLVTAIWAILIGGGSRAQSAESPGEVGVDPPTTWCFELEDFPDCGSEESPCWILADDLGLRGEMEIVCYDQIDECAGLCGVNAFQFQRAWGGDCDRWYDAVDTPPNDCLDGAESIGPGDVVYLAGSHTITGGEPGLWITEANTTWRGDVPDAAASILDVVPAEEPCPPEYLCDEGEAINIPQVSPLVVAGDDVTARDFTLERHIDQFTPRVKGGKTTRLLQMVHAAGARDILSRLVVGFSGRVWDQNRPAGADVYFADDCIRVLGGGDDTIVEHCIVSQCGEHGFDSVGIDGGTVRHNRFYHTRLDGIMVKLEASDWAIHDNYVYHADDGGIMLGGGSGVSGRDPDYVMYPYQLEDVWVYNNVVVCRIDGDGATRGSAIRGQSVSNAHIYNNTLINGGMVFTFGDVIYQCEEDLAGDNGENCNTTYCVFNSGDRYCSTPEEGNEQHLLNRDIYIKNNIIQNLSNRWCVCESGGAPPGFCPQIPNSACKPLVDKLFSFAKGAVVGTGTFDVDYNLYQTSTEYRRFGHWDAALGPWESLCRWQTAIGGDCHSVVLDHIPFDPGGQRRTANWGIVGDDSPKPGDLNSVRADLRSEGVRKGGPASARWVLDRAVDVEVKEHGYDAAPHPRSYAFGREPFRGGGPDLGATDGWPLLVREPSQPQSLSIYTVMVSKAHIGSSIRLAWSLGEGTAPVGEPCTAQCENIVAWELRPEDLQISESCEIAEDDGFGEGEAEFALDVASLPENTKKLYLQAIEFMEHETDPIFCRLSPVLAWSIPQQPSRVVEMIAGMSRSESNDLPPLAPPEPDCCAVPVKRERRLD
ncbi:MAG: hypothetical protein CME06_02460 [Gemmatimonadetes bacterium]|nr:hypothetical protein [Gemmatimonadota bacterium]